ncbi:MAG: heat-inducible transcriptional repressor HrcA [Holophaga sp.]
MTVLNLRSETVLKALIEAYLLDGEPVGSRLLAHRFPEPVSSATIRNVLTDLEEEALVTQPHTSAGRIPTERAYRYYVDHWMRPQRPAPHLGAKLATAFEGMDQDPDAWLRHASRVLSEVMGGICIALPVHLSTSTLVRLEFVPLGPRRLVAVWVGSAGDVEHQVMENSWGFEAPVLAELGNFATWNFAGCSLTDMRQKLLAALQGQADEAHQLRLRLAELAERMAQATGAEAPLLAVAGLRELLKMPEFEDSKRFRELVEAFEEHGHLAKLLNAFAEASAKEVKLLLGSENPYLPEMPLATAMRTVALPGEERAAFAFFGPLRLDYGKVIGGLAWWSEELAKRGPRTV